MKKQKRARAAKPQLQSTIAIVYDFDGTLTPLPMQEYTVLPELGIEPQVFWREVEAETRRTNGDGMLTYMRLLVESVERHHRHLGRRDLKRLGKQLQYFPGVESWFSQINRYVRENAPGYVKLKHYIISAGLREILEGSSIRRHFARIYASEYFFNQHDVATFPTVVINDTAKTQFLFRINKGREDLEESINEYMPEGEREIPFSNILYIGDGLTDVPCMTVTKKNGGSAIAVYNPKRKSTAEVCRSLMDAGRVDYFAAADYRTGRELERRVQLVLELMIARIAVMRERMACRAQA